MKAWLPAALMLASLVIPSLADAKTPAIAMEEFMVPTADAGIQIYVRNKHPADMARFRPERTLLFVQLFRAVQTFFEESSRS